MTFRRGHLAAIALCFAATGCGEAEPARDSPAAPLAVSVVTPEGVEMSASSRKPSCLKLATRDETRPGEFAEQISDLCSPEAEGGESPPFVLLRHYRYRSAGLLLNRGQACTDVSVRLRPRGGKPRWVHPQSACSADSGRRVGLVVLPARSPVRIRGLGALKRLAPSRFDCDEAANVCFHELDAQGRPWTQ